MTRKTTAVALVLSAVPATVLALALFSGTAQADTPWRPGATVTGDTSWGNAALKTDDTPWGHGTTTSGDDTPWG